MREKAGVFLHNTCMEENMFSDVSGLDERKSIHEMKQKFKGLENVLRQKNYTLYFWIRIFTNTILHKVTARHKKVS